LDAKARRDVDESFGDFHDERLALNDAWSTDQGEWSTGTGNDVASERCSSRCGHVVS
jgi:hypothetical protein